MLSRKEIDRRYYLGHKEKVKEKNRKFREENPLYSKKWWENNRRKQKKYQMEWKKKNIKKAKEIWDKYYMENITNIRIRDKKFKKEKYKTDLRYHINDLMSRAIRHSLKGNKNNRSWSILVDYKLNDLIRHLKKTLPDGYIWQDYIEGKLHIDHIIPVTAFNFTKPEHIDFKRCWALGNLRLLPARENIKKNNKLSKPFQPALKI
jgi:hypothetical protein